MSSPIPILVVEDSPLVIRLLRHLISANAPLRADYAPTLADAKALCARQDYFAAIVDLTLPDAPHGEAVAHCLAKGIPTLVLTGSFDEHTSDSLHAQGVVDYIPKEGRHSYERAVDQVKRLYRNRFTKVMVVDDSSTVRRHMAMLLRRQQYQVLEAGNGQEALDLAKQHGDLRLVVTDYQMPQMDGFALVQAIRQIRSPDRIALIGLSSKSDENLVPRFLKFGADDFLHKPFCPEEFYCRVERSLDALARSDALRDAANRDHLTGLYNRRYFYSEGFARYECARQQGLPITVAVVDIDHFKSINDTYGHQAGDQVLVALAQLLTTLLPNHLVARAGGEEFFILFAGVTAQQAFEQLEGVRQALHRQPVPLAAGAITVRFSAGICSDQDVPAATDAPGLDPMLNSADDRLYFAKRQGRDRTIMASSPAEPLVPQSS